MTTQKSRSENAKLNIFIGLISQIITILFAFVGRKIFVIYLNVEYLGINGLYTNILSVLSLAELGFGTVVSFSLYKPVADNDHQLIRSLLRYFKKVYMWITAVIIVFGVALVPFLKYIVVSDLPEKDLIIYYLIFLLNTVSSYFVAHKVSLMAAYQENRLQKLVAIFTVVFQEVLHILVLVFLPNYLLYIATTVFATVLSNFILNSIADKKYSYLSVKDESDSSFDKKTIIDNVKSTALYKISAVVINNTDNILISVLVNTVCVGIYSNYLIIVNALQNFFTVVTSSLISGIGNIYALNDKNKLLDVFKTMVFAYHYISCFCCVCLYLFFNDFISIWLGSQYLLEPLTVLMIALNFYLTNLLTPVWSFREATGIFVKTKYILLCTAIVNIVLSVFLGTFFGITGILAATGLSRLLTVVWCEPKILFKYVFQISQKLYWKRQAKYFICSVVSMLLCLLVNGLFDSSFVFIIIRFICYFIICTLVFSLVNFKTDEFSNIILRIKRICKIRG